MGIAVVVVGYDRKGEAMVVAVEAIDGVGREQFLGYFYKGF
jgi:hypothetical protein